MKVFNYIPLEFQIKHTNTGSFILPIRTDKQENYKKELTNYITKKLKTKTFYDLKTNEDLFRFMNSYVDFNKKNSNYPKEND